MESSFENILSAEELLQIRKESGKSLGKFSKFNFGNKVKRLPEGVIERDEFNAALTATLETKFASIEKKRVKQFKDIGEAVYIPNERCVRVTKSKNKPSFMGFVKDGETYLFPEEILFLMESEAMQITHNGLPISIQEAFFIFLKSCQEFNCYKIYSHLSRYGFKLKRHTQLLSMKINDSDTSKRIDSFERRRNDSKKMKSECNCGDSTILTHEMTSAYCEHDFFMLRSNACKNWKEVKEKSDMKVDNGYFSHGLILKDPCLIHYDSCADDVMSLRNISEITNAQQFYKKLKNSGPTVLSSNPVNSNVKVCFDCYVPSNKKTSDVPDYYIIVVDSEETPVIMDIVAAAREINYTKLLFAVVSETEFNFYKFTTCEIWDEMPILWESSNAQ